jgi:N-methylhydantoinase B
VNEGSFRALKVILPPGKLLSARRPAPIGGWSLSLPTVLDTIFRALAPALPERVPAAHKGDMGGYAIFGTHPRTGRRYVCQNIMGGGWGGRPFEDGMSASVSMCQGDVKIRPSNCKSFTIRCSTSAIACAPTAAAPANTAAASAWKS